MLPNWVQLSGLLYKPLRYLYGPSVIMLSCIECPATFKTLRELRRHERCHVRKLYCTECDCYFSTRSKKTEHIASVHRRTIGTQTESHRQHRRPREPSLRRYQKRRRWQPDRHPRRKPTPQPEVELVIVPKNPTDPLRLEDELDLMESVDIRIGV